MYLHIFMYALLRQLPPQPPTNPSIKEAAAFGRLHNSAAGAFGADALIDGSGGWRGR